MTNPAKNVTPEQGRKLWDELGTGWKHARDIDMPSRTIRAVCAAYPDRFISSQKGYKRLAWAIDAELEEAVADLLSRIKHLSERAAHIGSALTARRQRNLDLNQAAGIGQYRG